MIDEPFYVLTEGAGAGWLYPFVGLVLLAAFWGGYREAKSTLDRFFMAGLFFVVALVWLLLIVAIVREKTFGRPRLEFYPDGLCHYDVDGSNRYIAWLDIKSVEICQYPSRNNKTSQCSGGEPTPRGAPSFNRSFYGVKLNLLVCGSAACSVFIDSMYMSGLNSFLSAEIDKADKNAAQGKPRICTTLPGRNTGDNSARKP